MRRTQIRHLRWAPLLAVTLMGLAALAPQAWSRSLPRAARGSTVRLALPVGATPVYIFPLTPPADFNGADEFYLQYQMWEPLYWFGNAGKPLVNYRLSLAYPPEYSNAGRTITIRLKHWRWSDGRPVTTRDVRFWLDLVLREKANWGAYAPGDFLDHIVSVHYPSATVFSITLTRAYSHGWLLYNELSQLIPIPQHAWDRTSASGPIGNSDETPAGAAAVYTFLNSQSKDLAGWDTNPLWQVVDGPYRLQRGSGFAPATGYTVLVANRSYSGPARFAVTRVDEVPFTSDQAEFDALRAGELDYGYLPVADLPQRGYLAGHGFRFDPWVQYGMSFIGLNFTNTKVAPIFDQLYVRQALQRLIDQPAWIRAILKGYGWPTYGPIPVRPANPFSDSKALHNPYPYSVAAARALLSSHGWTIHRNGTDTCQHPGTGAHQCGAGIAGNEPLQFSLQYVSGEPEQAQMMESLRSSAAEAGIDLVATQASINTVFGDYLPCDHATGSGCQWDMINFNTGMSTLFYPDYYPTGDENFATGAGFNGGGYSNLTADRLIAATEDVSGAGPLDAYQNYLEQQLPVLWLPGAAVQFSEISTRLHGVTPQDAFGNIYPQFWSLSG